MKLNNENRYYLSKYNRFLKRDDHITVYNLKFGNVIRFESDNISDVKEYLLNEPSEELLEMGFVCDNEHEISEEKYTYYKTKCSTEILNVMLIMTYECNCCCKYCFENLDGTFLNCKNEKIDEVIDYIIDIYTQGKSRELQLHFFGGEPTLQIDKMVYAIRKLRENNVNVIPNVITNGVALNKNSICKLIENNIFSYQITIDGEKEIHDTRRPMKNGLSSWDKIIENLRGMADTEVSVTIRINIDAENISGLKNIYESIPEKLARKENFRMYVAPVVGCITGKDANETLKKRAENIKKAWRIIKDFKLPIDITPPSYYPCPNDSCESAFYVDLFGNIYNCGGFVGKKENIERTIWNKTPEFYQRIERMPDEKCFQCEFSPVCRGGCEFEKRQLGLECQYFYLKEVYDEYYEKYAK